MLALTKFLGTWLMEGRTFASPVTKDVAVRARETFEWLPGERFLVHRIEGTLGDSPMACIDITDHDGTMRAFYNDGSQREFRVESHGDDTWTYTNELAQDGITYQNRCTVRFSGDRKREATWELSRDGKDWTVYWRNTATRVD